MDIDLFVRFDRDDFIAVVGTAPPGSHYADRFRRLAVSVTPAR